MQIYNWFCNSHNLVSFNTFDFVYHLGLTKIQILHLYSNQIFFIYNQVSLHVSANVGHPQVNTIQGVTIYAVHTSVYMEAHSSKTVKTLKT
jgi:hypothetical protein